VSTLGVDVQVHGDVVEDRAWVRGTAESAAVCQRKVGGLSGSTWRSADASARCPTVESGPSRFSRLPWFGSSIIEVTA
jgi:hypothetical protein